MSRPGAVLGSTRRLASASKPISTRSAVFAATGNVIEFPTGKPLDPAPSAELVPVEITCFVKESGRLTKKIRLAEDGRP